MIGGPLTTKRAARFLGTSVRSLERHRANCTGPFFIRQGNRITYRLPDLRQWQDENCTLI